MFVSLVSIKGNIIGQFKLRETIGFMNVKKVFSRDAEILFAIEMFSENVYIFDEITNEWDLTNYVAIFSKSSEESYRKVVGVQRTDGRTLMNLVETWASSKQFAELFLEHRRQISCCG